MKVLWHSNAPFVGTGYGGQVNLFAQRMANEGHKVMIASNYGHRGAPIRVADNVTVLPSSYGGYGGDVLGLNAEIHQPDIYIGLFDVWVYEPSQLGAIENLTWWTPVDHEPIPYLVADRLKSVKHIWAMSKFGEREIKKAGLSCWYVPHGVDTAVFTPLEKVASRKSLGWGEDKFIAVSVVANKGYPSRKNLPEMIKAWAMFCENHPESVLYLHTETSGNAFGGIDVGACAKFYGLKDEQIVFPNQYNLMMGMYSDAYLAKVYSAGDVLLMPSAGEGFGVPTIEAQACGLPVIVTDATAQAELCGSGWRVRVDDDDRVYTLQNSEQFRVKPSAIFEALELAYEARGDVSLREYAREFALMYDADKVWREYMRPAIEAQQVAEAQTVQAGLSAEREARTKIRLQMRANSEGL